MRTAWLAFAFVLACAASAAASPTRGLLSPTRDSPAFAQRGGQLFVDVQVASGLTPPPGIQSERALRGFVARLCADGAALGGPARLCTPTAVRDVRPHAGHSLVYRVELRVPFGLAPGRYDLELRFPGGVDLVPASVSLDEQPGALAAFERDDQRLVARAPGHTRARLRLHLDAHGVEVQGAEIAYYPRYGDDGTFAQGSVALLDIAPGQTALVTKRKGGSSDVERVTTRATVQAGDAVALQAPSAASGQVFWRLTSDRGAQGRSVDARFYESGHTLVHGVAIDRSGTPRLFDVAVEVAPRLPAGCAVTPVEHAPDGAGLLLVALCWKLAAGRRRRTGRWNSARRTSVARER
jgi:hypothetical protein